MSSEFSSVGVIGAGQMGAGIAQVCAAAGISTSLYDSRASAVSGALESMQGRMKKQIEKGKIDEKVLSTTMENLVAVDTVEEVAQADLIIEAIIEDVDIKCELLAQLDKLAPETSTFASNTSSISITRLASATSRPQKCIGLHFMNPVPVMELVEVIRGIQTSEQTYQRSLELISTLSKTAVTAKKDFPGFIVNRILVPMMNEAFYVLMEGIASPEDIDAAMKLGTNQPMGPLTLADFVGLDTCLAICEIFHSELGEDKYRPCPLLRKYVEAGWYGRKSGRGVYNYTK